MNLITIFDLITTHVITDKVKKSTERDYISVVVSSQGRLCILNKIYILLLLITVTCTIVGEFALYLERLVENIIY